MKPILYFSLGVISVLMIGATTTFNGVITKTDVNPITTNYSGAFTCGTTNYWYLPPSHAVPYIYNAPDPYIDGLIEKQKESALRDQYAGQAMQVYLYLRFGNGGWSDYMIASSSYQLADEMMKQRKK